MDFFPQESVELAKQIVGKYRKRGYSKKHLAAQLYDGKFLEIGYGFSESIKKGNCGRFLHEIDKETDCFTMAGVLYLVAREAGLEPELYYAKGMRDIAEGANKQDSGRADHSFIVVKTGKDKKTVIDPFMNLFGEVVFDESKNRMSIYSKQEGEVTDRDYNLMMKLSEKEYVKRLKKQRTPKGGRIALSATQKLQGISKMPVFLTYSPETRELKSSIHTDLAIFGPEPYTRSSISDLTTSVNPDGSFSFEEGDFSVYNAIASGWTEHTQPQVPIRFKVKDAQKLFDIWNEFMKLKARKAPISRMFSFNLINLLYTEGFDEDFSIAPDSLTERVIQGSFSKTWKEILQWQSELSKRHASDCSKDEISYKTLLRDAHKTIENDKRKSKDNPRGLIYTNEQREELRKQEFDNYSNILRESVEAIIQEHAVKSGVQRKSRYHAEREKSKTMNRNMERAKYFRNMALFSASSFPFSFHMRADSYMFNRQFDLEKLSVSELKQGLTQQDVKRAAQKRIFIELFNSWHLKDVLFLKQYHQGLEKILRQ